MEYIVKLNESQVETIQAALDILHQHITMTVGGMKELNETREPDSEREELIDGSKVILKEVDELATIFENLGVEVKPNDFIDRKRKWKNKKKS